MIKTKIHDLDFVDGELEVRLIGNEVALYMTNKGLRRLVEILEVLQKKGDGHIHLEDWEILTQKSKIMTLVLIEANEA